MRVANSMIAAALTSRLTENYRELARVNLQISSGKRLQRLGDDPAALCRSMALKSALETFRNCSKSIDCQVERLKGTDSALQQVTDLLHRASEISLRGSTDNLAQSEIDTLVWEVDSLIEDLALYGNSVAGLGREARIFSFNESGELQIDPSAATKWELNTGSTALFGGILTASQLTTTVDPIPVFWGDPDDSPGSGSIFAVLKDLRDALAGGDRERIKDSVDTIKHNFDQVSELRASVGIKINQLLSLKDFIDNKNLGIDKEISNFEGIDLEKAAIELSQRQAAYEAAMAISVKLMQTSLLDYLK